MVAFTSVSCVFLSQIVNRSATTQPDETRQNLDAQIATQTINQTAALESRAGGA